MKKILLLLFIGLGFLKAQDSEILITPTIATTTIDSITVNATDTLFAPANSFTSVTAGMKIYGYYIPEGTVVVSTSTTKDTLIMSANAKGSNTLQSLNIGLYNNTQYTSGDWLGLPFQIFSNGQGGVITLISLFATDSSDQLGNFDIAFFGSFSDTLGLDNGALAIPGIVFNNMNGYCAVTSTTDLGTLRIGQKDGINLAIPNGTLYGRLIARSTPTFTATTNLKLRLRFKN